MNTDNTVKIALVSNQEYNNLALFLASQLAQLDYAFWMKRFKSWWDDNPAYSSANSVRGWVAKKEGRIVGFIGNIPTKFQLSNKEVLAFNGTNLVVAPDYRRYSIKLFLNQVNYSPIVFMTTPSDPTIPIFSTFKVPLLPRGIEGKYHRKSIVVLSFKNLLKKKLSQSFRSRSFYKYSLILFENLLDIPILNRGIAASLQLFFRTYQFIRLRSLKKTDGLVVKQVTEADSSFDKLWERTKHIYPNTNIRTAETINWYLTKTNRKIVLFGCYSRDILMGYIICKIYNSKIECIDLWIDPARNEVLDSLILFAIGYAKKDGLSLLIFPHFNRRLGEEYIKRGLITVYFDERKDYFRVNIPAVIDESNSYFVGLQGDHDLW